MRAHILVVIMSVLGLVSPVSPMSQPAPTRSSDPRWIRADALWQAVTADPAADDVMWRTVGEAFAVLADDPTVDLVIRRECAFAAFVAQLQIGRVRAVPRAPGTPADSDGAPAKPRPLDAEGQAVVDAATRFLTLAPDEHGPRTANARFMRASVRRRFDHLDEALVDFAAILEHERTADVGRFAANLLLDGLIRRERFDELIVWVRRLRADTAWLAGDPDLAARLQTIEHVWLRKQAEGLEQAAHLHGLPAAYVACGEAYDAARASDPDGARDDELLYDAARCFDEGADRRRALGRYGELITRHPRSALTGRARLRSAHLRLAQGDVGGARRDAGPALGTLGAVAGPLAVAAELVTAATTRHLLRR